MGKYCVYSDCKNYDKSKLSRSREIKYYPIPKPTKSFEKCMKWIDAINRRDISTHCDVKPHHYVCSDHFVGEKGPTENYPDPVKAAQQDELNITCFEESQDKATAHTSYEEKPLNSTLSSESLQPKLSTTVASIVNIGTPSVTNEPTCSSPTNFQPQLRTTSTSTQTLENIGTPSLSNTTLVLAEEHSLKELAQQFLGYKIYNVDTFEWSVDVVKEIQGISSLRFRMSSNSLITVEVTQCLVPAVSFANKLLSQDHKIFSSSSVDLKSSVSSLNELIWILFEIENWEICQGLRDELFKHFKNKRLTSAYVCLTSQSIRSNKCEKLFVGQFTKLCPPCRKTKLVLQNRKRRAKRHVVKSTNIRYMTKDQLKEQYATVKKKNKALKLKVKKS